MGLDKITMEIHMEHIVITIGYMLRLPDYERKNTNNHGE